MYYFIIKLQHIVLYNILTRCEVSKISLGLICINPKPAFAHESWQEYGQKKLDSSTFVGGKISTGACVFLCARRDKK
jgi:hypothetical protein